MSEGPAGAGSGPADSGGGPTDSGQEIGWLGGVAAYSLGVLLLVLALAVFLPWENLAGQGAVFLLAALVPGWLLLALVHDRSPAALGFYLHPRAAFESAAGLCLGLLVVGAGVGVMALAGAVRWIPDGGGWGEWFAAGGTSLAFLALPAAAEEALFRGYPLQVLARDWGRGWALLATSMAFAALHGANPGLTPIALLNLWSAGIFLGVVYLRTGSLWWATGAHLGWNWALGFWVDLPVSGLELVDTPIWTGVSSGPDWMAGGAFGPEGSLLTTPVILAASAFLWRAGWLRPHEAARAADPLTPLPEVPTLNPRTIP